MKYAAMLLLLCSYVMAKDVDLADYPTDYTVSAIHLDACIMTVSTATTDYVVTGFHTGTFCQGLLPPGYTYKGRQNGRSIALVYPQKGKWKIRRFMINIVSAR